MFRFVAEAIVDASDAGIPMVTADQGTLSGMFNAALTILGVVAIVFLIMGSISYMTSAGDQQKVSKAKGAILYSVIGLIVIILSFGIVNFVIGVF